MSIIEKAKQAAVKVVVGLMPDAPVDPLIGANRVLGHPIARVDGPLKVMGKARFAAEVQVKDISYAALHYSTIACGRIRTIDTAEAEASPGVLLVMTHKNAPRMNAPTTFMSAQRGASVTDQAPLQNDEIYWNGQPVAVIVAETQEQADHAASLIRVDYEPKPAATVFNDAKATAERPANILGQPTSINVGDAEAALREASFKIDNVYRTPLLNHCAIEPNALTVIWEDDQLTVHDSIQAINLEQKTVAEVFRLKTKQVRVLSPFVGGGFGNKMLWDHQLLAIAAAKLARRPVRLALSREGVFRATGGRTLTEQRVAIGAKADGTLAALIHTGTVVNGPHNTWPEQFTFPARIFYASDTFKIDQQIARLNMVANCPMRAPGESVGTFALESAIDELAEAMDLDPIELRRRNEPPKNPISGEEFSSRHIVEAYARGAERFGWDKRRKSPRARREGAWLIGLGVATATYPYYRMPGGAASIRLTSDGCAFVQMASHEMGMGTATVQAQHAAERLGLPMGKVTFEYGDSDMPSGTLAGGSSQTASIVAAVTAASDVLFKELIKLAGNDSPLAGLKANEIEARDGGLCKRSAPEQHETYVSILSRARRDDLVCEASASLPVESQKWAMHSYGAQFCEVRVNDDTGEVRVSRWLGAFDTGRILNPKTAASQFRGGIIMGLGLALMEETHFDERTGRIMNPSLAEYHIPVQMDVPEIDVIWNDIPDPRSPLGLHGIGEIGITGVGAAVANAVYNATGKRIRDLPITLDKVMTASP